MATGTESRFQNMVLKAESVIIDGNTLSGTELGFVDGVTAGTATASKAVVVDANKAIDTLVIADGGLKLGSGAGTAVTSTAAELNKIDDSVTILTKGSGVSNAERYGVGYIQNGTLVKTRIVLDLTGLVGSATDVDIIGNTGGAANCHWGQITTAKCGTLIGGRVTCLEVPAGGTADINFYSSSASTGAQDALASGLAGVSTLIDAGGAWTSGATKGMTALPAANDYLYIANGAASGGTFSAGKFEIVLFGTA